MGVGGPLVCYEGYQGCQLVIISKLVMYLHHAFQFSCLADYIHHHRHDSHIC